MNSAKDLDATGDSTSEEEEVDVVAAVGEVAKVMEANTGRTSPKTF